MSPQLIINKNNNYRIDTNYEHQKLENVVGYNLVVLRFKVVSNACNIYIRKY